MAIVDLERAEASTTIWLNREQKLNALNEEMLRALGSAIRSAAEDERTKILVIRGRGRAFCAGLDISLFQKLREMEGHGAQRRAFFRNLQLDLVSALERVEKPVICAVHGLCLGAGFELAMACDIRIGTANASLALPEVRLGVIPEAGGCHRLARHVGVSRAKEIAMTGRPVDSDEALRLGLLHRVVSDLNALSAGIDEYRKLFASCAPLAVGAIKRVVNESFGLEPDAGLDLEVLSGNALYETSDAAEAAAAFSQRRLPRFAGR